MTRFLPFQPNKQHFWTGLFLLLGLFVLSMDWSIPGREKVIIGPSLNAINTSAKLRVATVNSPLTYYIQHEKPAGFEYDLVSAYAEYLGVELEIIQCQHFGQLFEYLKNGKADLAAASITQTIEREKSVLFSPTYWQVKQAVVYRTGQKRPRDVEDLSDRHIRVVANSSYAETLSYLSQQTLINWSEAQGTSLDELFSQIDSGKLEITLADSNILEVLQRFYPRIGLGFYLPETHDIAWGLPKNSSEDFIKKTSAFFDEPSTKQLISDLSDKYFSHLPKYNLRNTHYFLKDIERRLPEVEPYFRASGQTNQIDWKLLAALAYQESRWNPEAVSPTGVRGIMMLTQATSKELGVDRKNTQQSINGGTQYLARLRKKIPERIAEPDRTWMALAAYNIGFGHLEDARVITQKRGFDPDRWLDVAESLPLLTKKKWYSQTRYGYARGYQPVQYVDNIRSYYDILNWHYLQAENGLAISE